MKMRSFFARAFGVVFIVGILFVCVKTVRIHRSLDRHARSAHLFNPKKIVHSLPPKAEWDVAQSKDKHRFFYVVSQSGSVWSGGGKNCYMFSFSNNRYLLKLLRFDRNKPQRGAIKKLINSIRGEKLSLASKQVLYSAKLCAEELEDETGVVYAHLNTTCEIMPSLKICDAYSREFRIEADNARFIVQKKAVPFITKIVALMKLGKEAEAKRYIDHTLDLFVSLARKGYIQKDTYDVGFVGDKAIFLDVWHFQKIRQCPLLQKVRYHFRKSLHPIECWLSATYPSLAGYYQQALADILERVKKEKEGLGDAATTTQP